MCKKEINVNAALVKAAGDQTDDSNDAHTYPHQSGAIACDLLTPGGLA